MKGTKRLIGQFLGKLPGPLFICFGGIHGNEKAGVIALETIFQLLHREQALYPDLHFQGHFIGIRGNLAALKEGKRFIDRDLNRIWTPVVINRLKSSTSLSFRSEDYELYALLNFLQGLVNADHYEEIIVMDLHTTTADGGIFSIAPDHDNRSLEMALKLHAPVVKGILRGLKGTTLHYFSDLPLAVPKRVVIFEAGQHDDPLSVNRCISAIMNALRTIGCISADSVATKYDDLLKEYARNLPVLTELIMIHHVHPSDQFKMKVGFQNFQVVRKGDLLAYDRNGAIKAVENGMILMPMYQEQGEDGFFLIREI